MNSLSNKLPNERYSLVLLFFWGGSVKDSMFLVILTLKHPDYSWTLPDTLGPSGAAAGSHQPLRLIIKAGMQLFETNIVF